MNRLDRLYRATSLLLTGCVLASTMPAIAQSGSLTCSSNDGGYRYCRANTQNRVTLTRQISGSPCQQGYSWGYDYRGIWVDRGCRAQFQFGYDNNNNNGGRKQHWSRGCRWHPGCDRHRLHHRLAKQ